MSAPNLKIVLTPEGRDGRVRYLSIIDAVVDAIECGRILPGERLPAQRALADQFGVAVGTVTRAYAEVERRGLVTGKVGRGTFVSDLAERGKPELVGEDDAEWIDLTINRPPSEGCSQDFGETLRKLSKRPDLADLLGHQPSNGHAKHRAAGAEWISRVGLSASPEQVIICNGVQHGLAVAFAALSRPGDLILTEDLNYPGIKLLEKIYHLRLRGLAMDDDGLCPESLEEACKRDKAKFLLCTPTVHNPTASVVPLKRRERIAELAAKYDLVIIEDDIYGFLPAEPMLPISTLVPERSYYINGTSKCIGAGVRIGYIVAPHGAVDEIATAVQATTWMASPLAAEIVSLWFNDGTADKIIQWHRREASARQKIAKQVLSDFVYTYHPVGYHIWLSLPEPWRREDFVKQTVKRHVLVTPAEAFVIGRAVAPHAVRVSLGGASDRACVERGLKILVEVLNKGPRLEQVIM